MISATLIVKNEESCLANCLESIKDIGEIIICDTGSTDSTIEIAKAYTQKVYTDFTWCDDFAKARNHALSKASGDWVLIIDADEELKSTVGDLEVEILKAEMEGKDTIYFRTISKVGGQEHKSIRLFKRIPEIYWKGAVHNYLSVTEGLVSNLRIDYGYSEAHKQDPDRALRILTKEVETRECIREKYYLAREYWYRKDYKTALGWYEKYLEVANWAPEMADAWLMVARCRYNLGISTAKDACLQAIKINADFKEALLLMADLSGPNNKAKWQEYANYANNKNVLFIR
jgi:glycosyltransferase involved in cell wall biosynthesis